MAPHKKSDKRYSCSKDQQRLIGTALFLLFLFSLLIIQFFRIQIVQHEKWEKQGNLQHTITLKEPFKRGVFYSNVDIKSAHPIPMQPLVIDVPKFHLYIDPKSIPENKRGEINEQLSSLLNWDEDQTLYARCQFNKDSRSRKVAMWIDTEEKEKIIEWWKKYARSFKIAQNGIYFVKDYQRSYPFGKLLGQVLHTVRELRDEETEQSIPTGGLEWAFHQQLRGKLGKRLFFRSPRHAMDIGNVIEEPENGADVFLTINHCLQAIVEEEIEAQVKKTESKRGWAVMMDPHTGEVLALAQYPFFYPEHYRDFFNDENLLEETQVKAICDPYEPGSTMKVITMAVALKANEERMDMGKDPLFDPFEKIPTSPTLFPGRTKPIKDLRNHKYMNMYMAIQKSSNVYMAQIIDRVIHEMGESWYRNILKDVFGFGKKTGIELPGESPGLLPSPGKIHPNGTLEWSKQTPYTLAMGHNVMATTFQMLRSFAIIANGGYDVKPRLVKKISLKLQEGKEKILLDNRPQMDGFNQKRLLSEKASHELMNAMRFVTKPGGAASKGDIYGYTEGGKTSTSEKIIDGAYSKKNHISSFIGFAPAENPRFVLAVVMDEPAYKFIPGIGSNQQGGNCAAPAFQRIGKRTLEYLGIEPDDPYGYPYGDPRRDPFKTKWHNEVEELKTLYHLWNS